MTKAQTFCNSFGNFDISYREMVKKFKGPRNGLDWIFHVCFSHASNYVISVKHKFAKENEKTFYLKISDHAHLS